MIVLLRYEIKVLHMQCQLVICNVESMPTARVAITLITELSWDKQHVQIFMSEFCIHKLATGLLGS